MAWRGWVDRLTAHRGGTAPSAEPAAPEEAPPPPPPPPEEAPPDGEDGAVWIQGGSLHVREPSGRGRWPSIVVPPDSGLEVLVNGRPAAGQVVVRSIDAVVLRAERRQEPARIAVELDGDEMAAWVVVRHGESREVRVPDCAPQVELTLRPSTESSVTPHRFTREDVEAELAAARVCCGIDPAAVRRALHEPGQRVCVARGEAPSPAGTARVWSVVHGDVPPPEAGEGGAAQSAPDVGTRRFVSVGQPVVQIEPADAPRTGQTVTGRVLPAPPGWRPELVVGPGALLSADGRTAIAGRSGRPDIRIEAGVVAVSVRPEHRVAGDLTATPGVLRWDGDVWVEGGIQAGAHIVATGAVDVRGRALRARIQAGGSIHVGGVTHCSLIAGGPLTTYAQILPLCAQLAELPRTGPRPGVPSPVASACARLAEVLAHCEGDLGPELAHLLEVVGAGAPGRSEPDRRTPSRGAAEALRQLAEAVAGAAAFVRDAMAHPGSVWAAHLENARVEATGAVQVGERGLWRSHVVCGGACVSAGPIRGGTILALGGADLPVIGSGDGWDTRVEVGPEHQIRAGLVHPGAVLVCGGQVRTIATLSRDVVMGPDAEAAGA